MSPAAHRSFTYCGIAIVFVVCLYAATRPELTETVRSVAGNAAIGSLLSALFVLLRDDIAFERKLTTNEIEHGRNVLRDEMANARTILRDELANERAVKAKDSENTFSIGATSHMANVAFDKHVQFCEEYIAVMADVTEKMLRSGPHVEALGNASSLVAVRIKWATWLTSDTERALEPFEDAVRRVGVDALLLKDGGVFADRHLIVQRVYAVYAEVLGIKDFDGSEAASSRTAQAVVEKLRKVLGTKELSELRSRFIENAHRSLDRSSAQT